MRKSLDRLNRQGLKALYAVEIAEARYGRQHPNYWQATYRYNRALRELGERMTDVYGYPVRRIGPRAVANGEGRGMRKAG